MVQTQVFCSKVDSVLAQNLDHNYVHAPLDIHHYTMAPRWTAHACEMFVREGLLGLAVAYAASTTGLDGLDADLFFTIHKLHYNVTYVVADTGAKGGQT